jgi:type III pantothenate kinase
MLLCLDVGNTHILGGVFADKEETLIRFRYATPQIGTADQFGVFLRNILQMNAINHEEITAIAVCSVVPSCNYTIRHAVQNYFKAEYFNVQAGVKTGLNIRYKNPAEVGADRIVNAIAAVHEFPHKNLIIVDAGTATTFCVVTKNADYLGGVILPGIRVSMEGLTANTAKLMAVDIEVPPAYLGQTTRESIQRGLYFGHAGALKEIISGLKKEVFAQEDVMVIGTGGFSQLFREEKIFDVLAPDLVLQGLKIAYKQNHQEK